MFITTFVLSICLYLYLIKGSIYVGDMQVFMANKIVHRGAFTDIIPENSLGAFEKAIEENYIIEFDVMLTRDNKVIVFHDDNFKRLTGLDKEVKDTTYYEVENLRINNTNEKIPLLKEALDVIDGRVPIFIEIKSTDINDIQVVEEVYEILKDYSGEYVIQSFNPFILRWLKENAPNVIRCQLSGDFSNEKLEWYKKFILKNLLLNFLSRPHIVAYELGSSNNLSFNLIKDSIPVILWTIKNESEMNYAISKASNVIFDYNMLQKEQNFIFRVKLLK